MKDPFYFGDTLALANVEFLGGQIVKDELRIAVIEGDYTGQGDLTELIPTTEELDTIKEGVSDNDPEALYQMGEFSEFGATFLISTSSDRVLRIHEVPEYAFSFYKKAADLDHVEAQFRTGNFLLAEKGVSQDTDLAIYYYRLAANHGHSSAMVNLGARLRQNGEEQEALSWTHKAADLGEPNGLMNLSKAYEFGAPGYERVPSKAFKLVNAAALQDSTEAQLKLAEMFNEGNGTEVDENKALRYFTICAEKGVPQAQFAVGVFAYQAGKLEDAFLWFLKAAQNGHLDAQINVAREYAYGEGTEVDLIEGYYWAKIASNEDSDGARLAEQIASQLSEDEMLLVEQKLQELSDD